jgi:hypothetical protein
MIQFRGRIVDSKNQAVKTELGTEMPPLKRWIERVLIPENMHLDHTLKVIFEWRSKTDEWTLIEELTYPIV